jgi:hypothetical protein
MRVMSTVFGFITALLLAAMAVPAAAQDRTMFGIELGARFGLPQCGPEDGSYPARRCFVKNPEAAAAGVGHDYRVFLPSAGTPAYVRGELMVSVIDGIVESVHINTWGFEAQHGALSALKKQFGEPTRTGLKAGKNTSRYRHRVRTAEWDFNDFSVVFDGVKGSIDWGLIKVSTHRYTKLMNDYGKRKENSAPKRY